MDYKTCTKCAEAKPIAEFGKPFSRKARNGKLYQHPWCSACLRQKASEYYHGRTPEQNIKYRAKALGLDADEVLAALAAWDNRCEICQREITTFGKKEMHIDHCHESLKFRGFLCDLCNKAVGLFRDDPRIMERAIEYVTSRRY